MSDVALQTEELTKRFGARTAVDRLTMSVERGDIYGFSWSKRGGEVNDAEDVVGSGKAYIRSDQVSGARVELGVPAGTFAGRSNHRDTGVLR
ncbi:MAG TPA: hypothetical protein VEV42_01340, partial [Pyrinomonadaceae bacterium]|nr:hypothetical protein [Pyrinomonadaceae bacterium]